MSLDIKYRPKDYSDVLGQGVTVDILREIVSRGYGYRQSYLFCGGHGSGKTTLGRILARALLCGSPDNGNPCNECSSCRDMLENGVSIDFVEVDAATNSGKQDVKNITEQIQYATFSGRRRIYLFDEAHQLSRDALDALLKPLEDTLPGSEDKRLTCIFCTTEPEKMRATVLSRCAPAFVVRPQKPGVIADRLEYICQQEGIEYERPILELIAEITECHIRDALKAVEGVSMLGPLNRDNATRYLNLDLNSDYLDILSSIGGDLPQALEKTKHVLERNSPVTCYTKLADLCMIAYRHSLGLPSPTYWDRDKLGLLASQKGQELLGFASRFANRPGQPTASMLLLDVATLHNVGGLVRQPDTMVVQTQAPPPPNVHEDAAAPRPAPAKEEKAVTGGVEDTSPEVSERDRAWVEAQRGPAALKRQREISKTSTVDAAAGPGATGMGVEKFAEILLQTLRELRSGSGGSSG